MKNLKVGDRVITCKIFEGFPKNCTGKIVWVNSNVRDRYTYGVEFDELYSDNGFVYRHIVGLTTYERYFNFNKVSLKLYKPKILKIYKSGFAKFLEIKE